MANSGLCFGGSDRGIRRTTNQDCFQIETRGNTTLGVVCDGIGGNKAGDIAAQMSCHLLGSCFKKDYRKAYDKKEWLTEAVCMVNREVFQRSMDDDACAGMGTTLVAFIADETETVVVNVGDSRCYILADNQLEQITEDHTLLNEMVKYRGYDYKVAVSLVGRNVISRAIGVSEYVEPDVFQLPNYQYLLICTDGLHGYVEDEAIETVLKNKKTAIDQKPQKLINLANKAGGYDNVTVVCYQR